MNSFKSYLIALLFIPSISLAMNPAKPFNLKDGNGKAHQLEDYKGKWVVLEWYNPECPFVKKHYKSGNMQTLQKRYGKKGVVWLSIISSAPGKQGHRSGSDAVALKKEKNSHQTAILLDPSGKVGRSYGAKTTPHMYVINPKGLLAYQGAIDDKASIDEEDIITAQNFVAQALDQGMKGKKITKAKTRPYGCSVKYGKY